MSILRPDRPEMGSMICPVCGSEATSKTETRVSDRLCEKRIGGPPEKQMPGQRWLRYEPCGHET